jgi:hypothetical protein
MYDSGGCPKRPDATKKVPVPVFIRNSVKKILFSSYGNKKFEVNRCATELYR